MAKFHSSSTSAQVRFYNTALKLTITHNEIIESTANALVDFIV